MPDTKNVTRTLARATGYLGLPAKWWASRRKLCRLLAIRPKPDQGRIGLLRVVVSGPARRGSYWPPLQSPPGWPQGAEVYRRDRTTAAPGRLCWQTGAAVVAW